MHPQSARPLFQEYSRAPKIQINRYAQVSRLKRKLLSSHSRSQKRSGGSYFDDAGSHDIVPADPTKAPDIPSFSQTQQITGDKSGIVGTDFAQTQKLTVTANRLEMPQG